jgi:hypothetical protein
MRQGCQKRPLAYPSPQSFLFCSVYYNNYIPVSYYVMTLNCYLVSYLLGGGAQGDHEVVNKYLWLVPSPQSFVIGGCI